MAQGTAKAVGGAVIALIFNEEERARGLTDFNVLHQSRGLDFMTRKLHLVNKIARNQAVVAIKAMRTSSASDSSSTVLKRIVALSWSEFIKMPFTVSISS